MGSNGSKAVTHASGEHSGNDSARLTPADIERHFGDGYREIEILPDGTLRESIRGADAGDETVTRSLKTERTWY